MTYDLNSWLLRSWTGGSSQLLSWKWLSQRKAKLVSLREFAFKWLVSILVNVEFSLVRQLSNDPEVSIHNMGHFAVKNRGWNHDNPWPQRLEIPCCCGRNRKPEENHWFATVPALEGNRLFVCLRADFLTDKVVQVFHVNCYTNTCLDLSTFWEKRYNTSTAVRLRTAGRRIPATRTPKLLPCHLYWNPWWFSDSQQTLMLPYWKTTTRPGHEILRSNFRTDPSFGLKSAPTSIEWFQTERKQLCFHGALGIADRLSRLKHLDVPPCRVQIDPKPWVHAATAWFVLITILIQKMLQSYA